MTRRSGYYGEPRALLADSSVVCLTCAAKAYLHIAFAPVGEREIDLLLFLLPVLRDRQGEPLALLYAGQNDEWLHCQYCDCGKALCDPACECYTVEGSICPLCKEAIALDDVVHGDYDFFHTFAVHVKCLTLGVITRDQSIYHSICYDLYVQKARIQTLTLGSWQVETYTCQHCGEALLPDDLYEEFFGHDHDCGCEICEDVRHYPCHDHAQREGYRVARLDLFEGRGFETTEDYLRFLGRQDDPLFLRGYQEGRR